MFDIISGVFGFPGGRVARPILAPDGTAALPAYSFALDTNTGFFRAGPDVLGVSTAGVSLVNFTSGGIQVVAGAVIALGESFLTRTAANIVGQYGSVGTAAQQFQVYNTRTDASNYERGVLAWQSNNFFVGVEQAGTGGNRNLVFNSPIQVVMQVGGVNRWIWNVSGHFLAGTDNTYDIGASGASRPRDVYIGRNVTITGGTGFGIAPVGNAWAIFGAGTTALASLRITAGVAPTAPVNGDIWFDGAALFIRIAGVTRTFTVT